MSVRQTWKTKIRGVLKLFNYSSERAEELSSAIYPDDSDESDSDTEATSSEMSATNTIASILQECNECGKMRTTNWCKRCESKEFIKQFSEWSSKNELLDKFIRNTQYKAYDHRYYWEWIPFDKFSNVKFLANGGQSSVFTAIWMEGPRNQWDDENMTFIRRKKCKVILKRLPYSPNNIGPEFINELRKYYGHQSSRCSRTVQIYGITQDPKTNCYMLVTAYHNQLDIRELLQEKSKLTWSEILRILRDCAEALLNIHSKGHIHKNLHPGNILLHSKGKKVFLNISDLGLHDNNQNTGGIIGVIPYVAPEVLIGWPYTQESDIYSFAMLMFELVTGKPPFYARAHDQHLIFDTCEGLRPQFDEVEIPECYAELISQCWDTEPVNRPGVDEILFIINSWRIEDFPKMPLEREQFEIHPNAIYKSRHLGELISRELELQDQFLDEAELSEQNEEEVEFSEEDDVDEEDEEEEEKSQGEQERESDDESMINSESDSEYEIESKTNKFQLELKLDLEESLSDSKIDEVKGANDTPPTSNETDDDDSLTEPSSNSTNSPNTSVFEINNLEMKHEMNSFNLNDSQFIFGLKNN